MVWAWLGGGAVTQVLGGVPALLRGGSLCLGLEERRGGMGERQGRLRAFLLGWGIPGLLEFGFRGD